MAVPKGRVSKSKRDKRKVRTEVQRKERDQKNKRNIRKRVCPSLMGNIFEKQF